MEPFSIGTQQLDSAHIVAIKGSIGMLEVDQVDSHLARLANQKPTLVIIDLAGVSMIGSSAMGSLVGFRRDISKNGGQVRLARVSPLVFESLKRAMFDRLFKIFDTVENAVNAVPGK